MPQGTKKDEFNIFDVVKSGKDIMAEFYRIEDLIKADPGLADYVNDLRSDLCACIESLNDDEIIRRLKLAGINRGDDWKYPQAKEEIFRGKWINSKIYDKQLKVVIDYVEGRPQ